MSDLKDNIRPYGEQIKTGTADSILAGLFRAILWDMNVDINRFNILLEKYIINANIPQNIKEISSTRGNLKKELLRSVMTWKVFIKGLMFLNVVKFDITVKLYHINGKVSEHAKIVNLGSIEESEYNERRKTN